MISIHIVTDEKHQGAKTIATAIKLSLSSLGVPCEGTITDGDVEKIEPSLKSWMQALHQKLGPINIVSGTPEPPEEVPDDEPTYTAQSEETPSDAATEALRERLKDALDLISMSTVVSLASEAEEVLGLLQPWTAQKVRGLRGYGWVIKDHAGRFWNWEQGQWDTGPITPDHTHAEMSLTIAKGRELYRDALNQRQRR